MNTSIPYLFGTALSIATPNLDAAARQSAPQNSTGPDYQEMCELQTAMVMSEILPQMKLRAAIILAKGFDSIEYSFRVDPKWPTQYVQSQVIRYTDGDSEKTHLGELNIAFPNPFREFTLRYWKNGKESLDAICRYPINK